MSTAAATTESGASEPLIEVRGLKKHFPIHKGIFNRQVGSVKAVDGVSFDVYPNETIGMVGESGCGKTTAGRTLLRLLEPSGGSVHYRGENIFEMDAEHMRRMRRHMQIIFQDPYSSLNPRMTVESLIGEAIEFHGIASGDERRRMVMDLLERVGLQPSYITRYPHEFSGGQRQRIGIARALALNPSFIVCDEAVSALDVSVQAQVINLLQDLQDEFELSYLFIAHDLSVVQHISDRIAVMYLGQIAEMAACEDLFEAPLHPYTQALLSAIPQPNPRRKHRRIILEGDVPSPIDPPSGCRFHTRCPARFEPCDTEVPREIEVEEGHIVRCHLYDERFSDLDEAAARLEARRQASLTDAREPRVDDEELDAVREDLSESEAVTVDDEGARNGSLDAPDAPDSSEASSDEGASEVVPDVLDDEAISTEAEAGEIDRREDGDPAEDEVLDDEDLVDEEPVTEEE